MATPEQCRENGKLGGRPSGSLGTFIKTKYLQKWEKIFDENPDETLRKIKEIDPAEFIRLGIAAMPKEQRIDLTARVFGSWTEDELKKFIKDGVRPDK